MYCISAGYGSINNVKFLWLDLFIHYRTTSSHIPGPHIDHGGHMLAKHISPDLDLIFMVYDIVIFTSNFLDYVSYFITVPARHTILVSYIGHGRYISASHVSPDLDLIFIIYWVNINFFTIRTVSPLPHNLETASVITGVMVNIDCRL